MKILRFGRSLNSTCKSIYFALFKTYFQELVKFEVKEEQEWIHKLLEYKKPIPIAIPIHAAHHNPAAVVKPLILLLDVTIMVPAPKNRFLL